MAYTVTPGFNGFVPALTGPGNVTSVTALPGGLSAVEVAGAKFYDDVQAGASLTIAGSSVGNDGDHLIREIIAPDQVVVVAALTTEATGTGTATWKAPAHKLTITDEASWDFDSIFAALGEAAYFKREYAANRDANRHSIYRAAFFEIELQANTTSMSTSQKHKTLFAAGVLAQRNIAVPPAKGAPSAPLEFKCTRMSSFVHNLQFGQLLSTIDPETAVDGCVFIGAYWNTSQFSSIANSSFYDCTAIGIEASQSAKALVPTVQAVGCRSQSVALGSGAIDAPDWVNLRLVGFDPTENVLVASSALGQTKGVYLVRSGSLNAMIFVNSTFQDFGWTPSLNPTPIFASGFGQMRFLDPRVDLDLTVDTSVIVSDSSYFNTKEYSWTPRFGLRAHEDSHEQADINGEQGVFLPISGVSVEVSRQFVEQFLTYPNGSAPDGNWSVWVNGTEFTYTSSSTTMLSVIVALTSAINAGAEPVTASQFIEGGLAQIKITPDDALVPYNLAAVSPPAGNDWSIKDSESVGSFITDSNGQINSGLPLQIQVQKYSLISSDTFRSLLKFEVSDAGIQNEIFLRNLTAPLQEDVVLFPRKK